MIILHPFSLMQEIQHHENCLRPAIQGYSAIFFFAIHCCSECFGLLVRCPSWTSNSTEAENCTNNEQMRKLNCCWRTVIFLRLQSFHTCKQTVHKKKNHNHGSTIINDVLHHPSTHFSFSTVFMN